MKHLARGINPDEGIQVAVVFPNGVVDVYDKLRKNSSVRKYAHSTAFETYGAAKLWAAEFEDNNRKMKMKEKEA